MSDIAIRAEGLGKRYKIGRRERYRTIRDIISTSISTPFRRLTSKTNNQTDDNGNHQQPTIWALEDVSFEIKKGEVVGIIGRNGAGKSTLLKILSRITKPTRGYADIYGRVGSLLEVGTGFHPELTGRENIYLNGAILGMRRAEIERKFDEIVDFSEIEQFLDTPVKFYSSGMYMRLAFSVAAHLEPEILLVDEVLAVGDAAFQKKCLGKMGDVAKEGRSVLFVSHNMAAVTRLCPRTILLQEGCIVRDDASSYVVHDYLHSGIGIMSSRSWGIHDKAPSSEFVRLISVRVVSDSGETLESVDIRKPVGLEMEYEVLKDGIVLTPNYHFFNEEGINIFIAVDTDSTWRSKSRNAGRYVSKAIIPGNLLSEGTIIVGAAISTMNPFVVHFYERDVVAFQVVDTLDGDSARGDYAGAMPGALRPMLQWETIYKK